MKLFDFFTLKRNLTGVKISAKVWKVNLFIPKRISNLEDIKIDEVVKWTIRQVLN